MTSTRGKKFMGGLMEVVQTSFVNCESSWHTPTSVIVHNSFAIHLKFDRCELWKKFWNFYSIVSPKESIQQIQGHLEEFWQSRSTWLFIKIPYISVTPINFNSKYKKRQKIVSRWTANNERGNRISSSSKFLHSSPSPYHQCEQKKNFLFCLYCEE